jgi:DNA-binding NarL/FixJ family response regulator
MESKIDTKKRARTVPHSPHLKNTVAIVEDDEPVRKILTNWVNQAEGFRCIADHGSAETALAALPSVRPAVVLMDINLPGVSGIECLRLLKPQIPETRFLMLTVYDDANHIFEALAAGAVGYLLKRTQREDLFAALREVLAGGSPMSSDIARKVVQSFQRKEPPPDEARLSPRESTVLDMLAQGFLYKEIADSLAISLPTVNTYVRRIYEKLHVQSRSQAVARYVQTRPGRRE